MLDDMQYNITKTNLEEIRALRIFFLQENNFQFIYNKCHDYGWADTYLFSTNGTKIGYGSIWGKDKRENRDAVFEFYLIEPFKKLANIIFPQFIAVSNPSFIECQSNDPLLSSMLYE